MEYIISGKNKEETNLIRKNLLRDYLKNDVYFDTYDIIGTDSQKIIIDSEYLEDKEKIQQILDSVEYNHIFLYRGEHYPIKQLKSINKEYEKIKNTGNVFYYHIDSISEELREFAHIFINKIYKNYVRVKITFDEMRHVLNLKTLGLVGCSLENNNGRLYIKLGEEEHHMDYENMSEFLISHMKNSDLETSYSVKSELDKVNIVRLHAGQSAIKPFGNLSLDNKHKFKLLVSFIKVCKENNLPMYNVYDIANFIFKDYGYTYFTKKISSLIKEESEDLSISNFKEENFDSLELAMSFTIYLSCFKIKHMVIINSVLKTYTVCYNYPDLLNPYPNLEQMRQRMIKYIMGEVIHHYEITTKNHITNLSLLELFNCTIVRGLLINDNAELVHHNPYDNKPLPVEYYDVRKKKIYSIFNIGNVVSGIVKRPPRFNRDELFVKDVPIDLVNGSLMINDVTVYKNIYFNNRHKALKYIKRLWNKGYFLTSYGLMYYKETGLISNTSLEPPEWFTLANTTEDHFFKFVKFNFSEYL